MKVDEDPKTKCLNVILKTYWIRLIQRRWRNIYKKRIHIQQRIASSKQNFNRENGGQNRILPSISGMLYGI